MGLVCVPAPVSFLVQTKGFLSFILSFFLSFFLLDLFDTMPVCCNDSIKTM